MRANRWLVLGCAVLVPLACFATDAKDESGAKTILVDCEKGDSINEALDDKADDLIIETLTAYSIEVAEHRSSNRHSAWRL